MDPRTLKTVSNDELKERLDECDRKLKELGPLLAEHEMQAGILRAEITRQTQHIGTLRSELERRNRPAPEPRISDHALLRYIERVHGVDMDLLRAHILTPRIVAFIQEGASGVLVDGVRFVVRDNVIVTVTENSGHSHMRTDKESAPDARKQIAAGLADYEAEQAA